MLGVRYGWHVGYPVPSHLTNFSNNFLHQGMWIFLFIIVSSMGVAGTWYTLQKSCIVFPVTHQAVYKYSYSCTGDLPLPLVPGKFVWTLRNPSPVSEFIQWDYWDIFVNITPLSVAGLVSLISIICLASSSSLSDICNHFHALMENIFVPWVWQDNVVLIVTRLSLWLPGFRIPTDLSLFKDVQTRSLYLYLFMFMWFTSGTSMGHTIWNKSKYVSINGIHVSVIDKILITINKLIIIHT